MAKPNTWAVVVGGLIAAVLTFVLIDPLVSKMFAESRNRRVNAVLREVASELNETVPTQVDVDTRLDRVTAEDRRLIYHYTITTWDAATVDLPRFEPAMRSQIVDTACNEMLDLLKLGVTAVYSYSGRDAKPLTSISVHQSDCEGLDAK
jgi:hypothetical protein